MSAPKSTDPTTSEDKPSQDPTEGKKEEEKAALNDDHILDDGTSIEGAEGEEEEEEDDEDRFDQEYQEMAKKVKGAYPGSLKRRKTGRKRPARMADQFFLEPIGERKSPGKGS